MVKAFFILLAYLEIVSCNDIAYSDSAPRTAEFIVSSKYKARKMVVTQAWRSLGSMPSLEKSEKENPFLKIIDNVEVACKKSSTCETEIKQNGIDAKVTAKYFNLGTLKQLTAGLKNVMKVSGKTACFSGPVIRKYNGYKKRADYCRFSSPETFSIYLTSPHYNRNQYNEFLDIKILGEKNYENETNMYCNFQKIPFKIAFEKAQKDLKERNVNNSKYLCDKAEVVKKVRWEGLVDDQDDDRVEGVPV